VTVYFNRKATLTIGKTFINGLDIQFNVKKTLKAEPNTANIKVWNLSEQTRATVEASRPGLKDAKPIPILLTAGYVGDVGQIYLGEVRSAFTTVEGPDRVTELTTGDGESAGRQRILQSIGPKTPVDVALRAIVRTLGIGEGNIGKAITSLKSRGFGNLYEKGAVLAGNSARLLTDFCKGSSLEWSIQDGRLQILDIGKALETKAFEVSAQTGMVGSPTIDSKGIASATVFLTSQLRPGVKVSFKAVGLKGFYRVTQVDYEGDTAGNDWYCKIKAEVLK
jgi:hypothetical protein